MKRIGITGGIGCGKSTVAQEFKRLGVPCFVCDTVAASYYQDPLFVEQIRTLLGNGVFRDDGSVDKQAIARYVFAKHEALISLNNIVHPRVMHDFETFCSTHTDADYVLFESAILFDYNFNKLMDGVICVYLDIDQRIGRLIARDNTDAEAIMARIENQIPAEEMMRRADYVILNYEGNPRQRQVKYIDNILRR